MTSYPAGAAAGYCILLVFFLSFFLLSFFLATRLFHILLYIPIQTKLGQSDQYLDHYSGTNDDGVRGHDGVTGVKKVIFTKKASSPTECVALTRELMHMHKLDPLYKSYHIKNSSGVIWGHRGQKVIFTKKGIKSYRMRSIDA